MINGFIAAGGETNEDWKAPLRVIKEKLDEAYKRYYELKKEADSLRETWLRDLAAMKANEEGGDQETIYNNLLERERQRKYKKQEEDRERFPVV